MNPIVSQILTLAVTTIPFLVYLYFRERQATAATEKLLAATQAFQEKLAATNSAAFATVVNTLNRNTEAFIRTSVIFGRVEEKLDKIDRPSASN